MDQHFLFYVPPDVIRHGRLHFQPEEARHIGKVLRKRPGDRVRATDGLGNRLDVKLIDVGKKNVTGEIITARQIPGDPERILAMGVIRQRDRLEFAIEKAVELGATRILLVHSKHSGKMEVKPARVDKTILSAMKQSQRCYLPAWEEYHDFHQVLSQYGDNRQIVMAHYLEEGNHEWKPDSRAQLLMVGPEGGFSAEEVDQAAESGAQIVRLGPHRLRAETAVCALLSQAAGIGTT